MQYCQIRFRHQSSRYSAICTQLIAVQPGNYVRSCIDGDKFSMPTVVMSVVPQFQLNVDGTRLSQISHWKEMLQCIKLISDVDYRRIECLNRQNRMMRSSAYRLRRLSPVFIGVSSHEWIFQMTHLADTSIENRPI